MKLKSPGLFWEEIEESWDLFNKWGRRLVVAGFMWLSLLLLMAVVGVPQGITLAFALVFPLSVVLILPISAPMITLLLGIVDVDLDDEKEYLIAKHISRALGGIVLLGVVIAGLGLSNDRGLALWLAAVAIPLALLSYGYGGSESILKKAKRGLELVVVAILLVFVSKIGPVASAIADARQWASTEIGDTIPSWFLWAMVIAVAAVVANVIKKKHPILAALTLVGALFGMFFVHELLYGTGVQAAEVDGTPAPTVQQLGTDHLPSGVTRGVPVDVQWDVRCREGCSRENKWEALRSQGSTLRSCVTTTAVRVDGNGSVTEVATISSSGDPGCDRAQELWMVNTVWEARGEPYWLAYQTMIIPN